MKARSTILCCGAAIVLLSGCVGDRSYGRNLGPGRGNDNGSYLTGYYDGYYGPYIGGYWSSDGSFYYQDRDRNYRRGNHPPGAAGTLMCAACG